MRIQILPLPSVMVGDDMEEPFALVFDQAEEGLDKPLLHDFAMQCGAKTFVIVPQTVEIVDRYAELPAPELSPDAAITRIRELHARTEGGTCRHCSENDYPNYATPWPCPTIGALEEMPLKIETAISGTLFDKPVRLEWPEGPPLGLSRQEIGEKLGSILLKPDSILLRDRNGNPMNLWVTCSCGTAMSMDLATTWGYKTGVVCRGCGNHLTITCPTDGRT